MAFASQKQYCFRGEDMRNWKSFHVLERVIIKTIKGKETL